MRRQFSKLDTAAVLRGFSSDRSSVAFVAIAFILLSKPQVLDFYRLLLPATALALASLHLAARGGKSLSSVRISVLVVALVVWLGLTSFWSDEPFITVIQTTSTFFVLVTAATTASFCKPRLVVLGVALGGVAVLLVSVGVAAVDPVVGLMPPGYQGGALRGPYVHRNLLAEVLAPAYVAALCLELPHGFRRLGPVAICGFLLAGVLATRSSTALAAVAVATAFAFLMALVRRRRRHRATALMVVLTSAAVAGGLIVSNAGIVFSLLQRDSTLTGRAVIWPAVEALINLRPLMGYGWGATWDPSNYVYQYVSATAKFAVPSAHNGYLDAWVQAGIVGLVGFVLILAVVFVRGAKEIVHSDSPTAAWGSLLVISLALYNIGEASLVSFLEIFLLALALGLTRQPGDATHPFVS